MKLYNFHENVVRTFRFGFLTGLKTRTTIFWIPACAGMTSFDDASKSSRDKVREA